MSASSYHRPVSRAETAGLLAANPAARILSGGTDLIVQMRSGRLAPGVIIDVKQVAGMQGIISGPQGFVIGAATPCTALMDDRALCAAWPGVVEAANLIGSVQVRNRATMAGNLCNASPAADSVPALIAAGACCLVVGPAGERVVPVADIPAGPGKTTLASGEFVAEIRLPARPLGGGDAYLRSTPRSEMDIAVVGIGAALVIDGAGICTAAQIALGAVGPTAIVASEAGAALIGTRLDDAALEAMAAAVRAVCRPIADKRGTAEYRTAMAGVLSQRAARIAAARARGEA
ncbi:MAG: hypothetical protein RLZZ136_103 [Pseudomonadota bacterium]|jgi:carbon-monoxide dehydrogenase medium subunit